MTHQGFARSLLKGFGFPLTTRLFIGSAVLMSISAQPAQPAGQKDSLANRTSVIYWCPDRPDGQQIIANPEAGCNPLVSPNRKAAGTAPPATGRPAIKIEDIESTAARFLIDYRAFLVCCAADVGQLGEVIDLEEQASHLLSEIQRSGALNVATSTRPQMINGIIVQVAIAQRNLQTIRQRLGKIGDAQIQVDRLDYEEAGVRTRALDEDRESLQQEFRPPDASQRARTGKDISDSSLPNRIGPTIESSDLPNATGSEIGEVVSPYSDPSRALRPKAGLNTQDSTLPIRPGQELQDTSLDPRYGDHIGGGNRPSSSLPARVGGDIGDSDLNR
ncbi:MAG: hypothetical protein NW703_11735 [Nitrospiraceae bacterium]